MQDFDNAIEIDPSTIAIHFHFMIGKNGEKIFASLSEDDIGGDKVTCTNCSKWTMSLDAVCEIETREEACKWVELEIIGIHKG